MDFSYSLRGVKSTILLIFERQGELRPTIRVDRDFLSSYERSKTLAVCGRMVPAVG
jgi:hypothetical protein